MRDPVTTISSTVPGAAGAVWAKALVAAKAEAAAPTMKVDVSRRPRMELQFNGGPLWKFGPC